MIEANLTNDNTDLNKNLKYKSKTKEIIFTDILI